MNKYFIVSDIHSFYDQLKESLSSAGFKKSEKDHILVICGDVFDRGNQTVEVYNYIKSIPKKRRVLVKGNHESLFLELLNKDFPDSYDYSNGTVRTFCNIAGVDEKLLSLIEQKRDLYRSGKPINSEQIRLQMHAIWSAIKDKVAESEITKWIQSDEWKDYYEVNNYIFTHSFIPLRVKDIEETKWIKSYPTYKVLPELLEAVPDWRNSASSIEWEDARWGCPWRQFKGGLFDSEIANNKILVCGHWHSSDFHQVFENGSQYDFSIYFGQNLIALDGCTAASGHTNVLVIDEESGKCYNEKLEELSVKTSKPKKVIKTVPADSI